MNAMIRNWWLKMGKIDYERPTVTEIDNEEIGSVGVYLLEM